MTTLLAAGRILPWGFGGRRALLLIERNIYVYRSGWLVLLSGFFEPLFYLLSIGFGIGGVDREEAGPTREAMPDREFLEPAARPTPSMNAASAHGTLHVVLQVNYQKTHHAG